VGSREGRWGVSTTPHSYLGPALVGGKLHCIFSRLPPAADARRPPAARHQPLPALGGVGILGYGEILGYRGGVK